jgi:hypothetical protein
VLAALLAPLDRTVLGRRPAHGEWCALEVIGHLVVVDGPAFRERIRGIVAGDPEIPDANGEALAGSTDFRSQDLPDLLAQLRQERTRSAAFLRSLASVDLERSSEHHKYGALTAGDFAHEWAFHDQDHLQQILEAVKPRYMEAMTANMRSAMAAG